MAIELEPLMLESSLTMQKILEAPDHKARCKLLIFFMDAETKRLESKKSLKGLFSMDSSSMTASDIPAEEMISGDSTTLPSEPKSGPSTFFDDEDAFQ